MEMTNMARMQPLNVRRPLRNSANTRLDTTYVESLHCVSNTSQQDLLIFHSYSDILAAERCSKREIDAERFVRKGKTFKQ